MDADGVFPAEMPHHRFRQVDPLDDDTAERLLAGRLDPGDAPPAYAEVARLLRAAAGPPVPDELAGRRAALAAFRTARPRPTGPHRARSGAWARPRAGGRARGRLVALALAGTLAAAGLWIADGARQAPGPGSPSGGPAAAGSGSGAPGSGSAGSGAAGSLRQARPPMAPVTSAGPATATAAGAAGPPAGSSVGDRAVARHGGHGKPPKLKQKPGPKPKGKPAKAGKRT